MPRKRSCTAAACSSAAKVCGKETLLQVVCEGRRICAVTFSAPALRRHASGARSLWMHGVVSHPPSSPQRACLLRNPWALRCFWASHDSYSVHPMDAFISQPVVSGSAQGGPPNGRRGVTHARLAWRLQHPGAWSGECEFRHGCASSKPRSMRGPVRFWWVEMGMALPSRTVQSSSEPAGSRLRCSRPTSVLPRRC